MKKSSRYLEHLQDLLGPLGAITERAMFGGWCVYGDGIVFGIVADDALWLKADDHNRGEFERIGSAPFRPFPDKAETMSYYQPPPEFFDNAEVAREWASAALGAGRRSASRKPRRAAGKGSRKRTSRTAQ